MWQWVRLHFGEPFYLQADYLKGSLFFLVPGVAALAVAGYLLVRRQVSAAGLVGALVALFGLGCVVIFLSFAWDEGDYWKRTRMVRHVRGLGWRLAGNGKEGRFPANETELQNLAGGGLSSYARRGEPLPYRYVYVANASRAHLPHAPGDAPAIIYCAVSPDRKRFWLTATALGRPVGGPIVWEGPDRRPLIIEGNLDAEKEPVTVR